MTNSDKEKISTLASHILFDYATSLKSDDEFKSFIQAVDRLTKGCLSACKVLVVVQNLFKEFNKQEKIANENQ
jgi:hypothetical protein